MTSHDVVAFLRKQINVKKIGHGGTLDPAAAGVLPVFIGKATKAIQFFENADKEYIAEMVLGITTSTGDAEGNVLNIKQVSIDIETINRVFLEFTGKIEQIPPMYSAVRYKGRKLYEFARKGITVERKPRIVEIKTLELMHIEDNILTLKTVCSKGTYIRTLCEDIGQRLGCGAYLSCLIRTRVGLFCIDKAFTIEEVEEKVAGNNVGNNVEKMIIPIDQGLEFLPAINLHEKEKNDLLSGRILYYDQQHETCDFVRVYSGGVFIGIAKKIESPGKPKGLRLAKTFL